jgi:hypothetical protein
MQHVEALLLALLLVYSQDLRAQNVLADGSAVVVTKASRIGPEQRSSERLFARAIDVIDAARKLDLDAMQKFGTVHANVSGQADMDAEAGAG